MTPFLSASKSAAISGHTISRELHSQSCFPAQQGHPDGFLREVQLYGRACQLCTLPFGHSGHCHQMSLWLCNDVLSGNPIFSVSVMISLLQQGMLCRCKSGVLLPCAVWFPAAVCLCTLGAPSLAAHLHHHRSLPFVQASAALPVSSHGAGDSHLI